MMRPFCLRCSVQNSVLGDDVPANQLTTNNVFLAEPDHTNTALFVVGHVVHDLEILTQAGLLRAAGNVVLGQIANDEQFAVLTQAGGDQIKLLEVQVLSLVDDHNGVAIGEPLLVPG